jgi:hypothetical protein
MSTAGSWPESPSGGPACATMSSMQLFEPHVSTDYARSRCYPGQGSLGGARTTTIDSCRGQLFVSSSASITMMPLGPRT